MNNGGMGGLASQFAEQAKEQLEQSNQNNINSLASMVTVQEKNGKHHWMGIEVSSEMAAVLQTVTSGLPVLINEFVSGGAYKHSRNIYNELHKKFHNGAGNLQAAHKAGLWSAGAVAAALIGAQPTVEVVQAIRNRSKERREIRDNLEMVLESDKDAEKNNEVIQTAMEKTSQIMKLGFKRASAELPTVLLNGYFAIGNHKALANHEKGKMARSQALGSENGGLGSLESMMKQERESREQFKRLKEAHGLSDHDAERVYNDYNEAKRLREREIIEGKNVGGHESPVDGKSREMAVATGSIINLFLKQKVNKDVESELGKTSAYELIIGLRERINSGELREGENIGAYVSEIFRQNEKDRGRSDIGPALMEKLQPLADRIGEVISKRELDAMSLVSFVGDGKVLNKRHFVKSDKLEDIIDEQRKNFGSHEKTPLDEFLADFQNPQLIMSAVSSTLNELKGNDKAVFASMFSDDVLLKAGLSKKEIAPLRKDGHSHVFEFVKNTAMELGEKSPEELKDVGLSDRQIEAVHSLKEAFEAGDKKEAKSMLEKGGDITSAVRDYALREQVASGMSGGRYWTEKIHKKPEINPEELKKKARDIPDGMEELSNAQRLADSRADGAALGGLA